MSLRIIHKPFMERGIFNWIQIKTEDGQIDSFRANKRIRGAEEEEQEERIKRLSNLNDCFSPSNDTASFLSKGSHYFIPSSSCSTICWLVRGGGAKEQRKELKKKQSH